MYTYVDILLLFGLPPLLARLSDLLLYWFAYFSSTFLVFFLFSVALPLPFASPSRTLFFKTFAHICSTSISIKFNTLNFNLQQQHPHNGCLALPLFYNDLHYSRIFVVVLLHLSGIFDKFLLIYFYYRLRICLHSFSLGFSAF